MCSFFSITLGKSSCQQSTLPLVSQSSDSGLCCQDQYDRSGGTLRGCTSFVHFTDARESAVEGNSLDSHAAVASSCHLALLFAFAHIPSLLLCHLSSPRILLSDLEDSKSFNQRGKVVWSVLDLHRQRALSPQLSSSSAASDRMRRFSWADQQCSHDRHPLP